MRTAFSRLLRCTHGAAALEMTLVMPLLMVLLGGTVEMGRALHHHHVLEMSVRDATRYLSKAAVVGASASTPCAAPTAGTAVATAQRIAMYGTTLATAPPLLAYWSAAQPQTLCVHSLTRTLTDETGATFDVTVIRMEVGVDYEDLGLLTLIGIDAMRLTAAHEEVYIGG